MAEASRLADENQKAQQKMMQEKNDEEMDESDEETKQIQTLSEP